MEKEQQKGKRKTFVLDTNVLIHDPMSIYAFEDNRVVLPMKVIEELDKFKGIRDDKGANVREVTRRLDAMGKVGKLKKGVMMENGGIIQIVANYLPDYQSETESDEDYEDFELMDTSVPDNEIILTALKLQKQNKEKVIFISKDLNSRIKASALGIDVMDYDKQKVPFEKLYTGYVKVNVSAELITEMYNDNLTKDKLPPLEEGYELHPNTFFTLEDNMTEGHTSLGRYIKKLNKVVPIIDFKQRRDIWGIKPLNREQQFAFDALLDDSILLVTLIGQAGTGKTLLALAAGLQKTIDEKVFSKVLVSRPIIPMGKDIGYLPGTKDEKLRFWMQPIFDNLQFIFSAHKHHKGKKDKDKDINDKSNMTKDEIETDIEESITFFIKQKRFIELEALTYIRGRSLPKQYLIVDEAQNLTPHEIKTIISRAGEGTKIVLTGDPYQIDNPYLDSSSNGLIYTIDKFKSQEIHAHIRLTRSERSTLASLAAKLL